MSRQEYWRRLPRSRLIIKRNKLRWSLRSECDKAKQDALRQRIEECTKEIEVDQRPRKILGLTISQPFASLIATGQKFVENRSWPTRYRGPIAIHAGKGSQYMSADELALVPTGCIVAIADLAACVFLSGLLRGDPRQRKQLRAAGIDETDLVAHEHTQGPYCWVLKDVHKLAEPVPKSGRLGLWPVPMEISDSLLDARDAAWNQQQF